MAISFGNRLKAKITQGLLETLLEDVNFRIVPLGIEEMVREVKNLAMEEYLALDLPVALRKLPDFFVAHPDFKGSYLIEAKFRRSWSDATRNELAQKLKEQVQAWKPLYLVIFLGEQARFSDKPSSFLGVAKLVYRDDELQIEREVKGEIEFTPWRNATWNSFSRFQDVFEGVDERWPEATITKAIELIRRLHELEVVENTF